VYDSNGEIVVKLTHQQARGMAISPDGKMMAFCWGAKAPFTLSVAPTDGSPIRRLAFNLVGPVSGSPALAWSPDSSKIAFGGLDAEEGNGLFVVDVKSAKVTRLSTLAGS
jgi:Tol biopolymer transport system component